MKLSSIFSLAAIVVLLCSPEGVLAKKNKKTGNSNPDRDGGSLRGTTPSTQGTVDWFNNKYGPNADDREGDSSTTGTVNVGSGVGSGQAMESNVPPPVSVAPRILDVVVSYATNPQDVDWNLYNMANPGLAVLWSSFNEVTQPGVVVKRARNLRPGRYRLIMSNLKGQGISGGAGWVKIVNATGTEEVDTSTAPPTPGEKNLVFMHHGGFGPRLDMQFELV